MFTFSLTDTLEQRLGGHRGPSRSLHLAQHPRDDQLQTPITRSCHVSLQPDSQSFLLHRVRVHRHRRARVWMGHIASLDNRFFCHVSAAPVWPLKHRVLIEDSLCFYATLIYAGIVYHRVRNGTWPTKETYSTEPETDTVDEEPADSSFA